MDYKTVLKASQETASRNLKIGEKLSNVTLYDERFNEVKLLDFDGKIY